MLTGRFTYGLGRVDGNSVFSAFIPASRGLGQTDVYQYATSTDPFANISSSFSNLFSSLGPMEWGILIIGGYALISMIFTTTSGVKGARGYVKKRRQRRARRAEAEAEFFRA